MDISQENIIQILETRLRTLWTQYLSNGLEVNKIKAEEVQYLLDKIKARIYENI